MPDIQPVTNGARRYQLAAREQASDQFHIAGGWGSGTFVGSVGVTLNNLSIKNFFKKGAWRPYPMGQNQRLSISAQTNGTYYKGLRNELHRPLDGRQEARTPSRSRPISPRRTTPTTPGRNGTQLFPYVRCRRGSRQTTGLARPVLHLLCGASYERYILKNWTAFVVKNGQFEPPIAETRLGPQLGGSTDLSALRFDFSVSVQAHPPPIRSGTERITDQSLSEQERYQLDRIPQVGCSRPSGSTDSQQRQPGADGPRPKWDTWDITTKQGLALRSGLRSAATA